MQLYNSAYNNNKIITGLAWGTILGRASGEIGLENGEPGSSQLRHSGPIAGSRHPHRQILV